MDSRETKLERLRKALPESERVNAANEYAANIKVVERITGQPFSESPYTHFLAGWDAAMELRLPALSDENDRLHSQLFDLVQKQQSPQCEFCGDPATKMEFFEKETWVCDICSCT